MKIGLREILFIVLLMAMPIGAYFFVFRPHNARDAEMMKQIEAKQTKLRALNQAMGMIGDLKSEIASLNKAVKFFESKLPNEKEIDKVLQEVWKLAEASQLATKSIRTLERSPQNCFASGDGPHTEQPIAMQLEGDFMGFYTFLQAMENQPRIIRIHKMSLTKAEKTSEGKPAPEGRMLAEFTVSVFFERDDNKDSQPGTPAGKV
jgi:Tfp pilus assembly protein PilO